MAEEYIPKYPRVVKNVYTKNRTVAHLKITRRNGMSYTFTFDREDLDKVLRHLWRVNRDKYGNTYALTGQNGDSTYLHRLLDGTPEDLYCDFIDGDSHNIRKANLTRTDCAYTKPIGRSGERWVFWNSSRRKWAVDVKSHFLGNFNTVEEAVKIRDHYVSEKGIAA